MSRKLIEIAGDRHLETLGNCGGYYACPKDSAGNRLGPLVGYAGTYESPSGEQLPFVGDTYANFAKAEPHGNVLDFFAGCAGTKLNAQIPLDSIDAFCAAPIGGYSLCDALGLRYKSLGIKMLKAEKKVTALKTPTSREKSELVFARHDVGKRDRCVIVEDVCNNFSTTGKFIQLIQSSGGIVIGIVCFLNRSLHVENVFTYPQPDGVLAIPVVSLVRKPIPEWRQDDPAVKKDIAIGNVVYTPKDEWERLMLAMHAQSA